MKQTYEREMRYGYIDTSIAKVLLFGIAGSGKTSATAIMFLVAVIGIGIWWLLHSVGKPDLVISSDTYQLHDLLCSYTCLGHCN